MDERIAWLRERLPPLKRVNVDLGEEDHWLWVPESAETVMNDFAERPDDDPEMMDERLPYWSELWPSAIALARRIATKDLSGKRVLELGCGAGLPGLMAGRQGADVCLSDYDESALWLARLNGLEWLGEEPEVLQLDWRNIDEVEPVDLLLAADVAYEKRNFEPLWNAFSVLVKPGGAVLFSEPGREIARSFISGLAQRGFQVRKQDELVAFRGQVVNVGVYALRKT